MASVIRFSIAPAAFVAVFMIIPAIAGADCYIAGQMIGSPNYTMPQYGSWKYTLTVEWDTGTPYALSHFNMLIDEAGHTCSCWEIESALEWVDPIGYGEGRPDACSVPFDGILECKGDPSIDYPGIILKFEPRGDDGCEPGPTGTAVLTFYSDFAPGRIAAENMFLTDKAGQTSCYGQLTGWFPALPCDPTPVQDQTWGHVKGLYGD